MELNEELLEAALNGDMVKVELLIEKGVDINAKDDSGWTALIHAARHGHTEIAEFLIQKGAEVDAKDINGWTALMYAAYNGHTETVELLIEKGADINAKNIYELTALMWAAMEGHIKTVKLLLQKGADIDAKTMYTDDTALMGVASNGHTEIAELLIENGANVVYALIHGNNDARETINQIAEEKPELFTKEQKFIFEMYSNPEKIPQDKKKEVIKVLREFQKKGLISKEESLKLFRNLQKEWNKNTNIITNKEMRKPEKTDKRKLRKIVL